MTVMTLGQTIWRARWRRAAGSWIQGSCWRAAISPKRPALSSAKGPKIAPSRDIDCRHAFEEAKTGNYDVGNPANGGRLAGPQANPLLQPWQTPFETPPFAEIAPEHFLPAFEQAFADHAAEIAAIAARSRRAGLRQHHHRAGALRQAAHQGRRRCSTTWSRRTPTRRCWRSTSEVSLRMARHWNPIMMNAVLFGRIALLHDNRATLGLTGEQMRLLERTYTRFHRAGAGLDEAAKKRMAEINERLAAARHRVQPPSARRRAGLVHGARRGRPRRPVRTVSSPPPGPRPRSAAWPARRS